MFGYRYVKTLVNKFNRGFLFDYLIYFSYLCLVKLINYITMFTLFKTKTLSLEFRSKEGRYKFTLINEFAVYANRNLVFVPEFKKTTKTINNVEYVVFECIKDCSCTFGNSLMLNIDKGDYIKIIK